LRSTSSTSLPPAHWAHPWYGKAGTRARAAGGKLCHASEFKNQKRSFT